MLNSCISGICSNISVLLIKLLRNVEYAITHFQMIHFSILLKFNLIYYENIFMSGVKDIMSKILPCKLKQVKTFVQNGLRFAVMISLVPSKGQYMKKL